ncbi:MAG: type VI secretion system tube protein Hcp [Planctomycetales bacterium]|nr:type VI secretion system tube protein Hcp [Planctomycetales bacterium]
MPHPRNRRDRSDRQQRRLRLESLETRDLLAIYLELPGIDGESTNAAHDKWIEIESVSDSMFRSIGSSGPDRIIGDFSAGDVNLLARFDKAAPKVLEAAALGTLLDNDAKIHITNSADQILFEYELAEPIVSSASVSANSSSRSENYYQLSLNFTGLSAKANEYNDNGELVGSTVGGFDLTGKANLSALLSAAETQADAPLQDALLAAPNDLIWAMEVPGSLGDLEIPDHTDWIEVSNMFHGVFRQIPAADSGVPRTKGTTDLSDFEVVLPWSKAAPALLSDLDLFNVHDEIKLQLIDTDGKAYIKYEIFDAAPTGYALGPDGLSISYDTENYVVTHSEFIDKTEIKTAGKVNVAGISATALQPASLAGIDDEAPLAAPALEPAAVGNLAPVSFEGANLLLKIPDIDGDSTLNGYAKWIEINSFDWHSDVALSGTGDSRNIVKEFSDLHIRGELDSAWAKIHTALEEATKFDKVELHVVASNADSLLTVVEFDLLGDVRIEALADFGYETSYSLSFSNMDMLFRDFDDAGKIEGSIAGSYKPDGAKLAAPPKLLDTADTQSAAPAAAFQAVASGNGPSEVVMKIDDILGNSTVDGHVDEIDVQNVTLSWSRDDKGVIIVEPALIYGFLDKASPKLMKAVADGAKFDSVQVHSLNRIGDESKLATLLEYNFTNATFISINLGTAVQELALYYDKVDIVTRIPDRGGEAEETTATIHNPAAMQGGGNLSLLRSAAADANTLDLAGFDPTGDRNEQRIFVEVPGAKGIATADGHANWYPVVDVYWPIFRDMINGGVGGNDVYFASFVDQGTDDLIAMLGDATGVKAKIHYVYPVKTSPTIPVEWTLDDAVMTIVQVQGSMLVWSLNFTKAEFTYREINEKTGESIGNVTTNIDLIQLNSSLAPSGLLAATDEPAPPTPPARMVAALAAANADASILMQIPGVPGNSPLAGRKDWLVVDDVSFGFSRSVLIANGERKFGDVFSFDVSVAAVLGMSWPRLVDAIDGADIFNPAKIEFVTGGTETEQPIVHVSYEFDGSILTSLQSGLQSNSDVQSVASRGLSFNFTKFKATFNDVDAASNKTTSGTVVSITSPYDITKLNLYGKANSPAPAPTGTFSAAAAASATVDARLVGDASGPVVGSLFADDVTGLLHFVKTGAPLAADRYTFTLDGSADGVLLIDGSPIDGDFDGLPGGDLVETFIITVDDAPALSLPDVVRGPGQAVELAEGQGGVLGIPIVLGAAAGTSNLSFVFRYDPALLSIHDVAFGIDAPDTADVAIVDSIYPGELNVRLSGVGAMAAGETVLVLNASVPATATIGDAALLRIDGVRLNVGGDEVTAPGDRALETVAFFGDVSGASGYSALDASFIARVAVGLDAGFDAFKLTDPKLLGDVTGDGTISALDAAHVARKAVGLDTPFIPDVPAVAAPPPLAAAETSTSTGSPVSLGAADLDPDSNNATEAADAVHTNADISIARATATAGFDLLAIEIAAQWSADTVAVDDGETQADLGESETDALFSAVDSEPLIE